MTGEKSFTLPVCALILLSFILGTSEFVIIGILPDIAAGIDCSIVMIGNLISFFAIAYAIGTPLVTACLSQYNRYYLLIGLTAIFILSNIMCGLAVNYTMLLVSRIIIAIVSGTVLGISMTFPNELVSVRNRPKVISWIFSGFSVAAVFGVPFGTFLSQMINWRSTFIFLSVFSFIVLVLLWRSLPNVEAGKKSNLLHQFALFKSQRIQLGMVVLVCSFAGTYTMYTYLTPILQNNLHIPDMYISLVLSLFGFCTIISNLGSGRLAGIGGIRKLPIVYIVQGIALFAIPFTVNVASVGLVNIMILGVTMYLHNASLQIFFLNTASLERPEAFTLASSLNPISANIGIALGSAGGSLIVMVADMPYVGFGGVIFMLIALLVNLKLLHIMADIKKRPHISRS